MDNSSYDIVALQVSQEVDSDTFCGAEIIKHQTSLKEVVVLQTDLCDMYVWR